jgi:Na+/H+ antiporter NhaD/arsenite permease-like protein
LKADAPTIRLEIATEQLVALLIFIATYLLLATGYRERTIAAMAGVGAIFAFGILSAQEMIGYVDMNAIGLLFAMMVIVGALREAKFFRWLGVYIANACHCRPVILLVIFTLMTAGLSAVLPNVTTVLFMVTVTIDIAELAKLDPKPYILSEIVASNIGGTATLIGDPPNIMIATSTGFSFREFLINMGPISLIALLISLLYSVREFRKSMRPGPVTEQEKPSTLTIVPSDVSLDRRLAWTGFATLVGAVVLFFLQDVVGIYPTVVALAAAVILLFVGGPKMPEILNDVEWSTLLFFGSLFIVVGALEKTGWIGLIAQQMSPFVGENRQVAMAVVLWVSSLTSAFIDNIPFAAAFIPVLTSLGTHYGQASVYPLWWALSAGTGLGGNGTIIGSSANVIATGLAQARGVKIKFLEFLKVGMVIMLVTTLLANIILAVKFWG